MTGKKETAVVFNIERHALHDGPGIRTLIFLKGCPLRCLWCSNPEGQSPAKELMYKRDKCTGCLQCLKVCPYGAIKAGTDGKVELKRELCHACGRCGEACLAEAREIAGIEMTVEEVLKEILKDEIFYRNSGGGVTISGGEPLMQPLFLRELFRNCKRHHLHTAVETCLFVPWTSIEEIFPFTDLFLCDLKHMASDIHKQYTGVGNELILNNLQCLDKSGAELIIRVPVIPGFNDRAKDIAAISRFTMNLKSRPEIHLLPYHTLGRAKYFFLGREYPLEGVAHLSREHMDHLLAVAKSINPRTSLEI